MPWRQQLRSGGGGLGLSAPTVLRQPPARRRLCHAGQGMEMQPSRFSCWRGWAGSAWCWAHCPPHPHAPSPTCCSKLALCSREPVGGVLHPGGGRRVPFTAGRGPACHNNTSSASVLLHLERGRPRAAASGAPARSPGSPGPLKPCVRHPVGAGLPRRSPRQRAAPAPEPLVTRPDGMGEGPLSAPAQSRELAQPGPWSRSHC